MHRITRVAKGSVAERFGLRPGDGVAAMGGQPLLDEIDYQALSFPSQVELDIVRADGHQETISLRKEEGEPLGLTFEDTMALSPRHCRNKCVFCFIDQMPKGLRPSLYVKDDDWRYSLMMGNFVTLSNVDEAEFQRMVRRHASPLYVSIHATDDALRSRMMGSPMAVGVMDKLSRLARAGIRFHGQIVVCPGYNDGEALLATLADLRALAPAAASVALVPVGLTRWRQGLPRLRGFDPAGARRLLAQIAPFQEACRQELGTTFAFPSDEFYCLAQAEVPPDGWYERYPQIENGVGLLRLLETEMEEAAAEAGGTPPAEVADVQPGGPRQSLLIATGVSAAPHIRRLANRFAPAGMDVTVLPVVNHFFGETVTVAGLLTGADILAQLEAHLSSRGKGGQAAPGETGEGSATALLIPSCMLRHEGDRFLDDMTLAEFTRRAPLPVKVVGMTGQDFFDALQGR